MAVQYDGKVVDKTELKKEETCSDRLKAVRTLHQTVVGLRKALEESQSDLKKLRSNLPKNTCLFHSNLDLSKLHKKCQEKPQKINKTDKNLSFRKISISMDNLNLNETEKENDKNEKESDIPADKSEETNNVHPCKTDSEDSEEVDNIELIFTTDDTKTLIIQGDLESISDGEFDSKHGLNQYDSGRHSVLIETDISKCGVLYEHDLSTYKPVVATRGNTAQERIGIRRSSVFNPKGRPILTEISVQLRDSEVQTDISALPPNWKSEGHLINGKAPGLSNFTTLPSKFSIPTKGNTGKKNLKLSDKTKEARRILLSDIGFTSMVPELSRSVDHLCQKDSTSAPNRSSHHYASKLLKSPAAGTTSSSHSRFDFSSNLDWFDNSISSDKNPSSVQDLACRKKQYRPSLHSLDDYVYGQTCSVPPSPTHRRHSSIASYTLTGSFMQNFTNVSGHRNSGRKQRQRVTFKDSFYPQQSLPNINVDPEDSTDSLIDESEEYIRRSIDNSARAAHWLMAGRTFSDPNMVFSPPLSTKPFIPRMPNDLKRGNFVKVINKSGRVVGGKVQFVGHVPGKTEQYIGISLNIGVGDSDGSFEGNRYFTCEKNFGLFVPFRKIVMAWKI